LGFSLAFVNLPADPKFWRDTERSSGQLLEGQPAQVSPVTFESEEEAIALANDTVHGLAAYLYTADIGRRMRVAEGIETGMVGINRGLISDPAAPFGGVKESGIGREGAHDGLNEFLETKYIAVSW
jgi:succinate-semialdehyde dehydrogenase/glutarate-semialdehyde dehydrogenase